MNADTFAHRLRRAREEAGYTLAGLASDLNVSEDLLARCEDNGGWPSQATMVRMCSKLDVSLDWLTGRAPEHAKRDKVIKTWGPAMTKPTLKPAPTYVAHSDRDRL